MGKKLALSNGGEKWKKKRKAATLAAITLSAFRSQTPLGFCLAPKAHAHTSLGQRPTKTVRRESER